jgi:hypothetical protein
MHTHTKKKHRETSRVAILISNSKNVSFSFYVYAFSSIKSENGRAEQVLRRREGVWYWWRENVEGKAV